MMRVLQVIDRLNIGGAEKVMLNLTRQLLDSGIETGVLIFNSGFPLDKDIDSRAVLYELHRANKYSLLKLREANSICRQYHIVHVHMRQCHAYIRLAQVLFGGKYKLVFHDHYHIETDEKVPWRLKGLFKPAYYVGVNEQLIQWAKANLGLKAERTFLLQNTINGHSIEPYVYRDNLTVGAFMVANIRQIKNIEFALEVAKKMDIPFTIYGNKTDEDYYANILLLINDNRKIRIVQGMSDVSREYHQYNIAIHTSYSETGPLVLLEYLAAGMPFIAYKTGEVAATICDELPMLFMDSFSAEDWIVRINTILSQKDLPQIMRKMFDKYYSSEKYVNKCLEIYQNVLC